MCKQPLRKVDVQPEGGVSAAVRHAARTDDNQPAIIEALRKIGVKVYYIKKPVDLLCSRPNDNGRQVLIECKDPDGRLTKEQVEFIASWPGEVHVVQTPEQAIR